MSGEKANKKLIFIVIVIVFLIAGMIDSCSGNTSSYSSSSKYGNSCRMCGRSISNTQSVRTHGYCSSCAKILSERIK